MENQKATSVNYQNGSTKDDLLVTYGKIQGTIAANFITARLRNTNYASEPVKGGTVKVRRFKSSTSQPYGTARAAGAGDALQNNGEIVKIDTNREIAEEMSLKDVKLYEAEGGEAILRERQADFAISMGEELEDDYFLKLQLAAEVVDVSDFDTVPEKVTALIRAVEGVENENVKKVNRNQIVVTLAPEAWDSLEDYIVTLPNPRDGGADITTYKGVEVLLAVRQTVDAIAQVRGAVAQPVVMGEFKVAQPEFSEDLYAYLPYFFGTEVIMPDLVFKAAMDDDISI